MFRSYSLVHTKFHAYLNSIATCLLTYVALVAMPVVPNECAFQGYEDAYSDKLHVIHHNLGQHIKSLSVTISNALVCLTKEANNNQRESFLIFIFNHLCNLCILCQTVKLFICSECAVYLSNIFSNVMVLIIIIRINIATFLSKATIALYQIVCYYEEIMKEHLEFISTAKC
ncbi:hypothetical protein T01_1995 [Trichinella spiralis]|uniref:Uncharacterized protein n=1 Tax=Trichinella spiralis TaxID=6334 RepID=A0A0V1B9H4_TRISP|nr:hypothetical protein T01_1995 [Trichinella spiralis]